MATTTLFNNVRVSAPAASQTVAVPRAAAGASFDLSLTAPSPSGVGSITVIIEFSPDGGATWETLVSTAVTSSGLVARGPGTGLVPVYHCSGEVPNAAGALIRARIPAISGAWTVGMTLTT